MTIPNPDTLDPKTERNSGRKTQQGKLVTREVLSLLTGGLMKSTNLLLETAGNITLCGTDFVPSLQCNYHITSEQTN